MEKVRFVCLANSYKEGGRCVAGIMLDANDDAVFEGGLPKWIRPVCNTVHGEIPTSMVENIKLLDVLEMDVTGYPKTVNYQSENALFVDSSLKISGKYDIERLDALSYVGSSLFGTRGKAISKEDIAKETRSLLLVKPKLFEAAATPYDDRSKPQIRLLFVHRFTQYDFPVTDPVFLKNYQTDPSFLKDYKTLYLTISLGIEYKDWYYKLVAGVIAV
jgi:hypothetical protein